MVGAMCLPLIATMTAPAPPGPGLHLDPPSKKRSRCSVRLVGRGGVSASSPCHRCSCAIPQ
ncbi:hypothetical protein PR003_g3032 [Phytophthora rubi]|uniref:Uncharacterized protein n=1 Tax=Phytophthora rubi TaxID=129364 RepID=A0A6A4G0I5_9STRA|nr:hypothetical protein PR001_g8852 [Phytophthora rubi]KAE9043864.1 hypothetical protein PR002_g3119 [Phytophthora rubi]KAE9355071.1 hypothetical protein PR003_g3032 [Phytophthora rubi]